MVCPVSPATRPNLPIKEPRQGAQGTHPKLRFSVFVPTAEFSWIMRINPVSFGLHSQFSARAGDSGRGRPRTAPRRQHVLVPPERRQAFPSGEFT